MRRLPNRILQSGEQPAAQGRSENRRTRHDESLQARNAVTAPPALPPVKLTSKGIDRGFRRRGAATLLLLEWAGFVEPERKEFGNQLVELCERDGFGVRRPFGTFESFRHFDDVVLGFQQVDQTGAD
jgi:hypothetical protein